MNITYIHYAFCDAGLTPAVAEKHASYAAAVLCRMFSLPPDQVHVVHRARLPENEPIQFSCYKGKSPDYASMALAAKRVLPHLRRLRQLAGLPCGPEYFLDDELTDLLASSSPFADWEPGADVLRDECVLGLLATGTRLPEDDSRAQWLRAQAAAAAAVALPHTCSRYARKALQLAGDVFSLDIGQVAAALLEHRRNQVAELLAKGAK